MSTSEAGSGPDGAGGADGDSTGTGAGGDPDGTRGQGGLKTALSRTRAATALTLRRRDSLLVVAGVTVLYLLGYLWAIGDLAPGFGGYGLVLAADPLGTLFRTTSGFLSFAPVALVRAGPLAYQASLNTLVGLTLALLVGLNLGLTYLTRKQPAACGLESSAGVLAGIPALLSGTACCGPVVLIALGIQASGVLLTAFQVLLPAAAIILVGSLVLVGRQVRPEAMTSTNGQVAGAPDDRR
ncbi:hypothetical protein [Salinirussus salinus]|jgi:hypothetical protein|uniref:hypothetical protein n=1 Tax=Salinirussus salinus TaxID=1198300 RepID=UPI001F1F39DE|nr:hypothetical protein [Salinirussus salinus]